ncbi:putative inner membrane protein [Sporomusa ovata DSM 2662]|uniref:Probable transmembrane protein n=2 Tax=Sporomusa ovata TaxID=2378 RepID=A0A0U1KYB3_9FIRM|nr:putative transporter component [Sporomusa ovata DSM 2662]CQR72408.1 Probable transmembrane protein [Sporomusa ovata]
MSMKEDRGWSPYLAGALSGLVSIGSIWFVGKYLGASTTFVRTTGILEKLVSPERVASMPYFLKEVPLIDWQWMFVIGIAIGAFFAAVSSGSFRLQAVPAMWQARFGPAIKPRALVAFIGGIIAMFGARLADGCPSGHGLSGSLQLAVSGFIALACFFIGGLITANLLYKGGGKQ